MDLQARADKLAQLMEQRLDIRGAGLEAKLARAGRRLPRPLRGEAAYIVRALGMQENPRLARQIDWPRLERGSAALERHLRAVDARDRRRGLAISWLAGNAFNILIVICLAVATLAWRGLI